MSLALLITWGVVLAVLCTVLFAWFAGGRTEKAGAIIFGSNVGSIFVLQVVFGVHAPLVTLGIDLATAFAFGALALSAPDKLWPGVAGVGQTLVVTFAANRMLDYPLNPIAYAVAVNLSGLSVEVALVAGAWMHRWGPKKTTDELEFASA